MQVFEEASANLIRSITCSALLSVPLGTEADRFEEAANVRQDPPEFLKRAGIPQSQAANAPGERDMVQGGQSRHPEADLLRLLERRNFFLKGDVRPVRCAGTSFG